MNVEYETLPDGTVYAYSANAGLGPAPSIESPITMLINFDFRFLNLF